MVDKASKKNRKIGSERPETRSKAGSASRNLKQKPK